MSEQEIYDKLKDSCNLMALIKGASELKATGEDVCIVNKVVTTVKKELISKVKDVKKIPRIPFPSNQGELMSHIPFQVKDLSSPSITIDSEGIFVL